MNDQILKQFAQRLLTQEVGTSRESDDVAAAAVTIYTKLLGSLSPLLGEIGSTALFRRSVKLAEASFPCYTEARAAEQNGLLNAVGLCLRNQRPDVARNASVALLTAYIELLATLLGERLTGQLLQEAWPDLLTFPPLEKPHE